MSFSDLCFLIASDYKSLPVKRKFLILTYFASDSFKLTFGLRIGNYLSQKKHILYRPLQYIVLVIYKLIQHKCSVWIPIGGKIGPSFF